MHTHFRKRAIYWFSNFLNSSISRCYFVEVKRYSVVFRKYLFELNKSFQCCYPPDALISPLTYAVYLSSVHCESALKKKRRIFNVRDPVHKTKLFQEGL